MKLLSEINACVLIPTYNNEKTLGQVIEGVLNFADHVIVINDGATDTTNEILARFGNQISILKNESNKGKGYSLRKGFAYAIENGFEYALTIDSDGQHYPDDIPQFVMAAKAKPGALLMGARNMEQEGVPGKSSFGNKFSNFWFWVETGIKLPDTQTGYRIYPLQPLKSIKLYTNKFELEIEVIVKLAWRGVAVQSVPVKVLYDKATRVSHFRPFRDFSRISVLNTYLVTLTFLYYMHVRVFRNIKKKGLWNIIREEAQKRDETNLRKSASVGFGLFMGIVPIWGFQLMVGIPLAILFRLNKVIFIGSSHISIPPMIPIIIFTSYEVGGLFVKNGVTLRDTHGLNLEYIHKNFLQYATGACVLAVLVGILGFFAALILFNQFRTQTSSTKN